MHVQEGRRIPRKRVEVILRVHGRVKQNQSGLLHAQWEKYCHTLICLDVEIREGS